MFFLTGVARYLFVPMAEAVRLRDARPRTCCRGRWCRRWRTYLLKAHAPHGTARVAQSVRPRIQRAIDGGFVRLRGGYRATLERACRRRRCSRPVFLARLRLSFAAAAPWVGAGLLPRRSTAAQFKLHLRAPTGTRIEETAMLCRPRSRTRSARSSRRGRSAAMLDNIGLPYSGLNLSYTNSAPDRRQGRRHPRRARPRIIRPTAELHPRPAARCLESRFPGVQFSFIAPDIVSQILSFGLPAPIDVQIVGPQLRRRTGSFAAELAAKLDQVPGHRRSARPPGREPAVAAGGRGSHARRAVRTTRSATWPNNLLISLSGSGQTSPTFWLNPRPA